MKKLTLSLVAVCSLLLAGLTAAPADVADYQVTGPILSITDTTITVQKGKEKWEIAKGAATTGAADLKVGDKVTVHYTMTATTVESKPAGPKAAKKGAKTPPAPAAAASSPAAAPASSPAVQ